MNVRTPPPQRLEAEALRLAHGRTPVIEGLDLALPPGRVTAIVGPNGCGKSTLLAGLARLHAPAGGAVLLDGGDIRKLPARELARRLALLPQEASAPEGLTVRDLIRFGRQPHQGWPASGRRTTSGRWRRRWPRRGSRPWPSAPWRRSPAASASVPGSP